MQVKFNYSEDTIRRIFDPSYIPKKESILLNLLTTSSILAKKNSLFVPLKGGNFDGHNFILESLENGCELFLCEKEHVILEKLTLEQKKKAILVNDTLESLGILAKFHKQRFNPVTIAITGSNGKTTTKEILKHYFTSIINEDCIVYTEKNYNNQIGLPFTVFKINSKTKFILCEIGMNEKGEISKLSQILKPDISIITNIGSSHIGNFEKEEDIAIEKISIIEGMKEKSFLFVNSNIKYLSLIKNCCNTKKIELKMCSFNLNFIQSLKYGGYLLKFENKEFKWNLLGKKIVENLNLCIQLLKKLNLLDENSLEIFSQFQAIENRLSIRKNYFEIMSDCYNASFESMCSSIDAVSSFCEAEKKFYLILGDMLELGSFSKELHLKLGEFIAKYSNIGGIILIGKDSHSILTVLNKKNYKFIECFEKTDAAILKLVDFMKKNIEKDSKILIKGSRSIHLERIYENL